MSEKTDHCITQQLRIAVILPCHNEAEAIAKVVGGFKKHLSGATVYVFDNNSSDNTGKIAQSAGAVVYQVPLPGKGNVVRRMFADIEADIYVMADGDGTYDASAVPRLVEALLDGGFDMVVGSRVSDEKAAYRPGHRLGNKLLTGFAALLFGRTFKDMLSGYRIFSRRYVKSFPAHATKFEIETELAVHALELHMPVMEIELPYSARPHGSVSKLNTYQDGLRILLTILKLFKSERPFAFFGIGFIFSLLASLVLAIPILKTYWATGQVPRLPTALLCVTCALIGFLCLACGLILDTVTKGRIETKRFAYLQNPILRHQSNSKN